MSVVLEDGYGPEPADAARAIERVAEAGAVGGSIEDWDRGGSIYEFDRAVERVAAAADAAADLGFPFRFTARAENQLRQIADLDDAIARLRAYEAAERMRDDGDFSSLTGHSRVKELLVG